MGQNGCEIDPTSETHVLLGLQVSLGPPTVRDGCPWPSAGATRDYRRACKTCVHSPWTRQPTVCVWLSWTGAKAGRRYAHVISSQQYSVREDKSQVRNTHMLPIRKDRRDCLLCMSLCYFRSQGTVPASPLLLSTNHEWQSYKSCSHALKKTRFARPCNVFSQSNGMLTCGQLSAMQSASMMRQGGIYVCMRSMQCLRCT